MLTILLGHVEHMFYTSVMTLTDVSGPVDTALRSTMQTSLFGFGRLSCRPVTARPVALDDRSAIVFEPAWVQGSDRVFEVLCDEMPWRSVERPMYDRMVDVPRLICTVQRDELEPSHPLAQITTELEKGLGARFLSIGLNYYRDGNDSVAWHRDRIKRVDRPATVALVSLGSPRTLALRPYTSYASKTAETTRITAATRSRWRLGHGDLFVMMGACQRDWEHCVPKERAAGPRISLAFRCQEAAEGPRKGGAGVPPLWASHNLQ